MPAIIRNTTLPVWNDLACSIIIFPLSNSPVDYAMIATILPTLWGPKWPDHNLVWLRWDPFSPPLNGRLRVPTPPPCRPLDWITTPIVTDRGVIKVYTIERFAWSPPFEPSIIIFIAIIFRWSGQSCRGRERKTAESITIEDLAWGGGTYCIPRSHPFNFLDSLRRLFIGCNKHFRQFGVDSIDLS